MEIFRTPNDSELLKLTERRHLCEYFFAGIFIVRKDSLRRILNNDQSRHEAEQLIN